jgi:stringent starvation protein B
MAHYLLNAIYSWCSDNGLTPYVSAKLGGSIVVPAGYDKNGSITLNISVESTQGLTIRADGVSFQARFNGQIRDVYLPIENIQAIFAKENGIGMFLDNPMIGAGAVGSGITVQTTEKPITKKPHLTLVKP